MSLVIVLLCPDVDIFRADIQTWAAVQDSNIVSDKMKVNPYAVLRILNGGPNKPRL